MKKVYYVLLFTFILLLCGCNNSNEKLERVSFNNSDVIQKTNLYGCWKLNNYSIYFFDNKIMSSEENIKIIFNKDDLEYYEDNKSIKYNYILNNNYLSIDNSSNDYLDNSYSVILEENDGPKLMMISNNIKENIVYRYNFKYIGTDCK